MVKAFNIVANAHMVDPDLPDGPPTMLIAGDDPAAKETVTEILDEFGWETVDLGGIDGSRYLEPICMAWVRYGLGAGSWDRGGLVGPGVQAAAAVAAKLCGWRASPA